MAGRLRRLGAFRLSDSEIGSIGMTEKVPEREQVLESISGLGGQNPWTSFGRASHCTKEGAVPIGTRWRRSAAEKSSVSFSSRAPRLRSSLSVLPKDHFAFALDDCENLGPGGF